MLNNQQISTSNLQEKSAAAGKTTELIPIVIDGQPLEVPYGTTILEAANKLHIFIPTLCSHSDLPHSGTCRMCVVEVEGIPELQASCEYEIKHPISVHTRSYKVLRTRANLVDMLFSNHCGFWDHFNCVRSGTCELQAMAKFGASPLHFGRPEHHLEKDSTSYAIEREPDKCILCMRCVRTCEEIQGIGCLGVVDTGHNVRITTLLDTPLADSICISCGQCIDHCPTAALHTRDSIQDVQHAIDDPEKTVVIQTAPAPRAAIGECFGLEPGTALPFELNTALRECGFDKVFDTNFSADLTIMEEGTELLTRLYRALVEKDSSIALPMFTSCSPGWINFLESFYPEMIPNLSSAKSPQQMFGAVIKTYYAQVAGIDPKNLVAVSLMPCTAKKFECNRPEMNASGYQDVDYVLTTREMARMIKAKGLDLPKLEKSDFDDPFGTETGSGVIFGATGGVMESALRTVLEFVTGDKIEQYFSKADIKPVRGMEGVRKAQITVPKTGKVPAMLAHLIPSFDWLNGVELKVAITHGTANARKVLENIKAGGELASFHFIEFMACPGGCLGGGGQPIPTNEEIRKARAKALYQEDQISEVRKSFENPAIQKLYANFLTDGPCGEKSHHLLHTHYKPQKL